MMEKMQILEKAAQLARYASQRQSVIARNVANADTPGYRARDLPAFSEAYQAEPSGGMRQTRAKHRFEGEVASSDLRDETVYRPGAMSPNGNSVSLESEMMSAAEAKREHGLALAIYKTTLGIMRTSIGRR